MRRNTIQDLINWKSDKERKPLVLKGARREALRKEVASLGFSKIVSEFSRRFFE